MTFLLILLVERLTVGLTVRLALVNSHVGRIRSLTVCAQEAAWLIHVHLVLKQEH